MIATTLWFVALGSVNALGAEATVHRCDTLAADPLDENRVVSGVAGAALDSKQALFACEAAVREFPEVDRFRYQLGRAFELAGRLRDAAAAYETLRGKHYLAASHNLGMLYLNGGLVKQDPDDAISLLRSSAERGYGRSQYQYARMLADGDLLPMDKVAAAYWYQEAANRGHIFAAAELGKMLFSGDGVPIDYPRALKFLEVAAGYGFQYELFLTGYIYTLGLGVPKDHPRALEIFGRAAAQGHGPAIAMQGLLLMSGEEVQRDYAEAQRILSAAFDLGITGAMVTLGKMHEEGIGVRRDELKAYICYRLAADLGDVNAYIPVSRLAMSIVFSWDEERIEKDAFLTTHRALATYAVSLPNKQKLDESASWLGKAIANGSTEAMVLLANLHSGGDSLAYNLVFQMLHGYQNTETVASQFISFRPSIARAVELYDQAAALGSVAAKINLAILSELGHGAPKDIQRATAIYEGARNTTLAGLAEIGLLRIACDAGQPGM